MSRDSDYFFLKIKAAFPGKPRLLIGIVAVMVLILALGIFTPMWDMMRAVRGK